MARIVLDANFTRKGRFSTRELQGLANAIQHSVEIYVPIVVIWEWAEHAAQDIEELQRIRDSSQIGELYPIAFPDQSPSQRELVDQIASLLPRGIAIWEPKPGDFRDALEVQVLQLGLGERKSGTKTGAADHIVLACVRAQIGERYNAEPVVLASGDKKLRDSCKAQFGDRVIVANSRRGVLQGLTQFMPAEHELAELVEQELSTWFGSELGSFPMGFSIVNRSRPPSGAEAETMIMGTVEVAELDNLEVGNVGTGLRVGTAQFKVHGDVQLVVHTLDEDGLSLLSTEESYLLRNVVIHTEVDLRFDDEWAIEDAEISQPVAIELDLFEG